MTESINLRVILSSEFQYTKEFLKKHSRFDCPGCATFEKGEAFVFIDFLLDWKRLSTELHVGQLCWNCENEVFEGTEEYTDIFGVKTPVNCFSCRLGCNEVMDAFIVEVNTTSIHEILHLFAVHDEEQVSLMTDAISEPWRGCLRYIFRIR